MKKIVFVYWDLQKGGAELVALNLVNQLVKQGLSVNILTLNKLNDFAYHPGSKYVTSVEQNRYNGNVKLLKYFSYSVNLVKLFLKLRRYDVLVAGLEYRPSILVALSSFLLRKPFNIWVHCSLKEYSQSVGRIENYLFKKSLARAMQIVCCSNLSKASLLEYKPDIKNKSIVINNFIDFTLYEQSDDIILSNSENRKFTIISVGRLDKVKGFEFLINAFYSMQDKYNINCQLVICGGGKLRNELEQQITRLHLNSNVHLLGTVNNVVDHLKAADLFISSSTTEAYSISVLEALYSGLPVIVTKTGSKEIIDKFGVGDIIDYGNVEELASLMHKYIADKTYYYSQVEKIRALDFTDVNKSIIDGWNLALDKLC